MKLQYSDLGSDGFSWVMGQDQPKAANDGGGGSGRSHNSHSSKNDYWLTKTCPAHYLLVKCQLNVIFN